jgi:hypothetical protein
VMRGEGRGAGSEGAKNRTPRQARERRTIAKPPQRRSGVSMLRSAKLQLGEARAAFSRHACRTGARRSSPQAHQAPAWRQNSGCCGECRRVGCSRWVSHAPRNAKLQLGKARAAFSRHACRAGARRSLRNGMSLRQHLRVPGPGSRSARRSTGPHRYEIAAGAAPLSPFPALKSPRVH